MKIEVYTDGGCIGNGKDINAPGGLGVAIYIDDNLTHTYSKVLHEKPNTNQKSELHAAIAGLNMINNQILSQYYSDNFALQIVTVYSDSAYVIHGITEWINSWKMNGWVNSKREPVANQDLWQQLDNIIDILNNKKIIVQWKKVKGHSGIAGNELVDQLAKEAMINGDNL